MEHVSQKLGIVAAGSNEGIRDPKICACHMNVQISEQPTYYCHHGSNSEIKIQDLFRERVSSDTKMECPGGRLDEESGPRLIKEKMCFSVFE
jgi:hypothetical protein